MGNRAAAPLAAGRRPTRRIDSRQRETDPCRRRLRRNPDEGADDARSGANCPAQTAGDLGVPAGAAAVRHRNFENAQPGAGRAHLHLDVPAVGHFLHAERQQPVARGSRGRRTCRCSARRTGAACRSRPSCPAAIWCQAMLPASRSPRAREPMTKSNAPARIGSTSAAMLPGSSAPSPSMNTMMSPGGRRLRRGEAGAAIARAGIDHVGTGGARARLGLVTAAAVGHDHPAHQVARNGPHHVADRGFLVQRRDRHDHAAIDWLRSVACPTRLAFVHRQRLQRSPQLAQADGGVSDSRPCRNER